MIRNSQTNIAEKPAISLSVIRSLLARLIKLLTFRHEHLLKAYTPHHLGRIEVHLQQLVAKGKLVQEAVDLLHDALEDVSIIVPARHV